MPAYTARPTSTNELTQLVNLVAHGFTVGQALIFNGAWTLAQANSLANCAGTWIVSIVPSTSEFYVTQEGWVNNLPAQSVGVQLYLSPTVPGTFTTVRPSGAGQVILPCMVCDTATTGYFYGGSGELIESGNLFAWHIESAGPVPMLANNGYMSSSGGTLVFDLPTVAALGDVIRATNLAGNFSVTCGVGQTINFGDDIASTAITSTKVGDSLELVCYNANIGFQTLSSMGNLTFV